MSRLLLNRTLVLASCLGLVACVLLVIGASDSTAQPAAKDGLSAKPSPRLVDSKNNPHAESVVRASVDRKNPERLSPMMSSKPFDAVAFKLNPKAYLDVVEPGRVFQVAQPSEKVPSIELQGDSLLVVDSGKSIPIQVKVLPLAAVTYTSFDLGSFDNGLTSVTVQADAKGFAVANFTATADTSGRAQVAIGCPVTAGICDVTVQIVNK
jgi:hypothetical protein